MNTLNTMIADIMPKDLVLIDLIQDKSKSTKSLGIISAIIVINVFI